MLSRWKNIVTDFLIPIHNDNSLGGKVSSNDSNVKQGRLRNKLKYHRPLFLNLTTTEEEQTFNHKERPFVTPKLESVLPFNAGYCEVINAGKTTVNEDCAVALTINIDVTCNSNKYSNFHQKISKNNINNTDDPNENHIHLSGINVEDSQISNRDYLCPKENKENGIDKKNETVQVVDSTNSEADSEQNHLKESGKQRNINPDNKNGTCLSEFDEFQGKSTNQSYAVQTNNLLRMDYFAIFDGHAGFGASLYASSLLHQIFLERLNEVRDLLIHDYTNKKTIPAHLQDEDLNSWHNTKLYSDSLITGILQDVMVETDNYLAIDRTKWNLSGGCTALVVVFLLGKVYVAGAGDCRAILCRTAPSNDVDLEDKVMAIPMSQDFTPSTERRRLQYLAYIEPSLLGNKFSRLEFIKRVTTNDVGKMVLYRDYHMTGWSYKEVTEADLKHPLIHGSGKASRLLATIGVTRGLGDHDLLALNHLTDTPIKPFLSSVPEIRVYDLSKRVHGDSDVLILGSDGLWDVMSNEMAIHIVLEVLKNTEKNDKQRYTFAARELAQFARGELRDGYWKMRDQNRFSSVDDISVFVIPLRPASVIHSI